MLGVDGFFPICHLPIYFLLIKNTKEKHKTLPANTLDPSLIQIKIFLCFGIDLFWGVLFAWLFLRLNWLLKQDYHYLPLFRPVSKTLYTLFFLKASVCLVCFSLWNTDNACYIIHQSIFTAENLNCLNLTK